MSDIAQFVSPVYPDRFNNGRCPPARSGSKPFQHPYRQRFPSIDDIDRAIVGYAKTATPATTGMFRCSGFGKRYLYNLYGGSFYAQVADLGNITAGHSTDDTFLPCGQPWMSLVRKTLFCYYRWLPQDLTHPSFRLQGSGANHQYCNH